MQREDVERVWPERLKIRDTGLHDDLGGPGQRIYTTAGRGYERAEYVRADLYDALLAERDAALAAAPQPAPAAADERAEIERIICDAFTCDLRGRGDEDGAFWQTAADALLAAGYRKADALLAERDALIHDIERGKESESALLAELEQARGIVRQGSRVNSDWFQRRDHMAPSRHSKKPGSCTFGPSTS